MSPEERFWSRVEVGEPDECWLWTGCVNKAGYGFLQIRSWSDKPLGAHRVAWALTHEGELYYRHEKHVHHRCHNRRCVNPSHLELLSATAHVHLHSSGPGCKKHGLDHWRLPPTTSRTTKGICRVCERERTTRYLNRKKLAA